MAKDRYTELIKKAKLKGVDMPLHGDIVQQLYKRIDNYETCLGGDDNHDIDKLIEELNRLRELVHTVETIAKDYHQPPSAFASTVHNVLNMRIISTRITLNKRMSNEEPLDIDLVQFYNHTVYCINEYLNVIDSLI